MKNLLSKVIVINLSIVMSCFFVVTNVFAQVISSDFIGKLESCQPNIEKFEHPFTGEQMQREIVGEVDGKCLYVEQMPNGGKMECRYSDEQRNAVAMEYRNMFLGKSSSVQVQGNLEKPNVVYRIDGKEVQSPLQESMNNGTCIITGYN